MVDKTVTRRQLQEMQKDGALIEFEKRPMVVEQFGELIETLKTMIDAQNMRAKADLARSQTQLEVLATLQGLIKKDAGRALPSP